MKLHTLFTHSVYISYFLCLTCYADDSSPDLTHSSEECSLDWQGVDGRTYFIKWSTDLEGWTYFPEIRSGDGTVISHGFSCNAPKFFLKLCWTDQDDGGDPNLADFDGDRIPNLFEIQALGTDPLDGTSNGGDTDGDGVLDGWELYNFGSVTQNLNGNSDGDAYSHLLEYEIGTDPNTDTTILTTTSSEFELFLSR